MNRYSRLKLRLLKVSGISSILTMLLLILLFPLQKSYSQYVDIPYANYLFNIGFFIGSLGFITNLKYSPLFIFLNLLLIFNTTDYPTAHNLIAGIFFLWATILICKEDNNLLFSIPMICSWLIFPFSILLFETIGIMLILLNSYKLTYKK